MDYKHLLRRLEKPLLIFYFGIWLLTYLLSRFTFEMYNDANLPWNAPIWATGCLFPLILYAAWRTQFSKGEKWYTVIWYTVIYGFVAFFCNLYIIVNGDLLFSSFTEREKQDVVNVLSIKKIIKRKIGFDHTEVTVLQNGKQIVYEARPYSYFYLLNRRTIQMEYGTSKFGNGYVTKIEVPLNEKFKARWLHQKDWVSRYKYVFLIVFSLFIVIVLKEKFFPSRPGQEVKKIGFWRLLGIIMGILIGLATIAYAGVWLYVHTSK